MTRASAAAVEIAVALEAVEQHVEALAEVAGTEVVETGVSRAASAISCIGRRIAASQSHRCSGRGRDRSARRCGGSRRASRRGTDR